MPVTKEQADSILAEFMARRGRVPVERVKRGRKGQLPASAKIDPLVKVEYEPDNSRIGCESKGIQTTLDFGTLAAIWVYEWHLEHEPIRFYLPVAPILPSVPYVVVREAMATGYTTSFDAHKHLDTGKYPVSGEWMRERINPVQVVSKPVPSTNVNPNAVRQEFESWQTTRTPKIGQRPIVLLPK